MILANNKSIFLLKKIDLLIYMDYYKYILVNGTSSRSLWKLEH